jgi:hypothetical protein
MKTKYYLGAVLLLFTAMACAAFSFIDNGNIDPARRELLVREVGHQVLLKAGDSTSRVLPVKRIGDNEYQIKFENPFAFQTDSLVKITNQLFNKHNLGSDYIVNVFEADKNAVIYGFAISDNEQQNIVACKGRKQLKRNYTIDIKFEEPTVLGLQTGYLIGGIPLIAFVGLMFVRSSKKNTTTEIAGDTTTQFQIGQLSFDSHNRQLINGDSTVDLTVKENNLLLIFARSPNVIVPRSRLQKEIWEDEGVIVGRSLDMFISKLRKKLEIDPSIQLVNIHGKGYRLEIVS